MRVRCHLCSERGSSLPLVAVVVVLVGACCVLVGRLGASAVDAAAARSVADAAALAGAAAGEEEAAALATANGGRLVDYRTDADHVEVVAVVGRASARARARATTSPGVAGAGEGAAAAGLVPELRAALARAEELLGRPVPVTSGWRSQARQQALWDARATNPFPVARPGTSMHERGMAVDVPRSFAPHLAAVAPSVGICYPYPRTDPVHFELCLPAGPRP